MPESQFDWTKLLQLVLFSSCEGVAFKKKKKKMVDLQYTQHGLFEQSIDPS
jgi:hypothetical protein